MIKRLKEIKGVLKEIRIEERATHSHLYTGPLTNQLGFMKRS